jgi:hypothetical protein
MALLRNCELFYTKLDPKRPNNKFDKENPTWDCQIRTTSKEVKKEWEALNLPVKAVVPDEGAPYYRVNLRKRSIKSDGTAAEPVSVVDGRLTAIDPNTIGNGSIGNIRIFQYEYDKRASSGKGVATILMGLQVTKHVVYEARPRDDDFQEEPMERVEGSDGLDDDAAF